MYYLSWLKAKILKGEEVRTNKQTITHIRVKALGHWLSLVLLRYGCECAVFSPAMRMRVLYYTINIH